MFFYYRLYMKAKFNKEITNLSENYNEFSKNIDSNCNLSVDLIELSTFFDKFVEATESLTY